MFKRLVGVFLFVFSLTAVRGQISFQFIPEISGRSVDGLFNCRIINAAEQQTGTLSISVSERKSGVICRIETAPFRVNPGSNMLPSSAIRSARIQFSKSKAGIMVSESNYFWEGDYEYCFTLNPTSLNTTPGAEQCYEYGLTPFAELLLIEPYNKDSICTTRPTLSWQPLIPSIPGSSYQLLLTEIKDNQSALEALQYNLPIVNQGSIKAPVLAYPSIAKELKSGKKYAWQVSAYKNQTVLNRSEVWEFTMDCKEDSVPKIIDEGYRDIEDLVKGNFYVASGVVKFAVVNSYKEQDLNYQITAITNPSIKINTKRLPKLKLLPGNNKIVIPLAENRAFKDGYYYILKMWLPNGSEKSLRFLYKSN